MSAAVAQCASVFDRLSVWPLAFAIAVVAICVAAVLIFALIRLL